MYIYIHIYIHITNEQGPETSSHVVACKYILEESTHNTHMHMCVYIYTHTDTTDIATGLPCPRERERIIHITHLKPLQPKTAITDDLACPRTSWKCENNTHTHIHAHGHYKYYHRIVMSKDIFKERH